MIEEELIYIDTACQNQDAVLDELIKKAYFLNYINDVEAFKTAVMAREESMPTSVGFEVAIPHGRCNAVKEPFVAFMKTAEKFIWNDANGELVDLIFLIGVPEENKDNLHLKCLSMISRKLMQETFRDALHNAKNVKTAFHMLDEIDKSIRGEN